MFSFGNAFILLFRLFVLVLGQLSGLFTSLTSVRCSHTCLFTLVHIVILLIVAPVYLRHKTSPFTPHQMSDSLPT